MSSIKRYMEDKAEKLSEAIGMEYDDALTEIPSHRKEPK